MTKTLYATPKEYLINTDQRIIEKIKELVPDHLKKHAPKFITYLINSPKQMSMLSKHSMYSVVLPSRYIDSHFDALRKMKDQGLPLLVNLGIVRRSNYNRATEQLPGLCREYNINSQVLLELILDAYKMGTTLFSSVGFKKIPVTNTGQSCLPHNNDSGDTDDSGSDVLSVVLDPSSPLYSVMCYNFKDVITIKDIEEYCVKRYLSLLKRKDKLKLKNPRRYDSELRSIQNDYYKYTSLLIKGYSDPVTQIFNYKKTFSVSSTGRLCETQGGLQGLSRGCKSYIYKDVSNLNNYDFQSSQLVLLKHFCRSMGINSSWIKEYIEQPAAKQARATMVGISVDAWKRTILSLVFGASQGRYGTPYTVILKDVGGNRARAEACFARWQTATEGLRTLCKQWLGGLKKYIRKNLCDTDGNLTNAVGIKINIRDSGCSRKFLSSFLLQGLESKLLSDLILFPDKNYQVVSPEFDGIVTVGTIDNSVWNQVLLQNGLEHSGLKLVNKSFS